MDATKEQQAAIIEMVSDYQKGVVEALKNASNDDRLPVIDLASNRFGVTNVGIKGEQYLVFSALKEGVKGYPKGSDVARNVVGIRINDLQEVAVLESWLEIIKANIVSKINLANAVPADAIKQEAEAKPEAPAEAAAPTQGE